VIQCDAAKNNFTYESRTEKADSATKWTTWLTGMGGGTGELIFAVDGKRLAGRQYPDLS
jgi:hypothetical protein